MPDGLKGLAAYREMAEALASEISALSESGDNGRYITLANTIAALDHPVTVDQDADEFTGQMALFCAMDRHGGGLLPFETDAVFEPGCVVIDTSRAIWLVHTVDSEGKPLGLSGGHPAREAKPLFRWNPATTARVWNNPTAAYGPAYRDLDQAMRDLGALWGLTESATRYFKKPESFFWQLTETRGVKIAQKGLDTDADAAAIRDWLRDQGMTARGDETPILIGDLVDSALCDGFGVIQRADGRMCDVLHIGRSSVGDLGEPKGSMQVRRGVSLPADVSIWTPR